MTPALLAFGLALTVVAGCGDDGARLPPRSVSVRASGCSLADELATGLVVGDGLVLTVAHVLRRTSAVSVDGVPGKVVAIDHRIDAALIAVEVPGPAVRFADEPATGPATVAGRPAVVSNIVDAAIEEPRDDTTYRRRALVLAAGVGRGDSGAPVVGPDGALLGMVFAASTAIDSRAYAVTADELRPFVGSAGVGLPPTTGC